MVRRFVVWSIFLLVLGAPFPVFAESFKRNADQHCFDKLLIAPPPTSDAIQADGLALVIANQLKLRTTLVCDDKNIVPQDQSRKFFDRFGVTSHFAKSPQSFYASQIEHLQLEFEATHIVFTKIDKEAATISVDVLRIQEDYSLSKPVYAFVMPITEMKSLDHSSKFSNFWAPLAANTVTLGFVNTYLDMDLEYPHNKVGDSMHGTLPPLISSISFNKIEHYRSYRDFDYGGSIFPGSFLFGIDQDTEVENTLLEVGTPGRNQNLHVEAYGACGTLIAEGAVHTPIGTTHVGIGYGPCILQKRQERREPVMYGTSATRIEFGHRAFFSESWYLYMDFDRLNFAGRAIYETDIAHTNSVFRSGIGIGYYIADTEHLFSDMWH